MKLVFVFAVLVYFLVSLSEAQLFEGLPELETYLKNQASLLQSVQNDLDETKQELKKAIVSFRSASKSEEDRRGKKKGGKGSGKQGQWPPGNYCILASGPCPAGFTRSSGHMLALMQYAATPKYITPATFGDSKIQCHGECGQYGRWIGELYITACCK